MASSKLNAILDSNSYIWLDPTIDNTVATRELKTHIQQIVKGQLQTFTDPEKCVDYITDIATQKIFLIVSNTSGELVVPLIWDIPQIHTVYVYCGNRQKAESWATPYSKVRGIFTTKTSFLDQIRESVDNCGKNESVSMSAVFRFANKEVSTNKLSEQCTKFLWYRALLTVLLHMAKYFNSKEDMVKVSRECYHGIKLQQDMIDEFDEKYKSDEAFSWYKRDSFVYRLLNGALRTQKIDIIFKFRLFINHLDKQIGQLYQKYLRTNKEKQLTFYRGQKMSMDEVKLLENNIDGLISMNSFLSTTKNRALAEVFAGADTPCSDDSLQNVLFIINVCNIGPDTTPFAPMPSCNDGEEEVLFTIGAIFKVESVKKKNNTWHVDLKLSKEENVQHKSISDSMMKELGSEPGPIAFGWYLHRISDFNGAISYANNILEQLSTEHEQIGDAYNLLGLVHKAQNHFKESVAFYDKALEAYSRSKSRNSTAVIGIHNNASLAYLAMGDKERAEKHRDSAASLLAKCPNKNNPLLISMTKSLDAQILAAQGDLEGAFQSLQVALKEKQKQLPPKHHGFGSIFNNMGIVQEKMGHDEKALQYFGQALECSNSLPENNTDSIEYHTNLGRIYHKREQYKLALEQFQAALTIMTEFRLQDSEEYVTIMKYLSDINEILYPRPEEESTK